MKSAIYFFLITFFFATVGVQAIETSQRGPKNLTAQEHLQNLQTATIHNNVFDNYSTGSSINPYQ
jgi:hypothetical protein